MAHIYINKKKYCPDELTRNRLTVIKIAQKMFLFIIYLYLSLDIYILYVINMAFSQNVERVR